MHQGMPADLDHRSSHLPLRTRQDCCQNQQMPHFRKQLLKVHYRLPEGLIRFPLSQERFQTENLHMRHMHSQVQPDSLPVHS